MWPDACHEIPGRTVDRCAEAVETHYALGDHRRCEPSACTVAGRWHDPVRAAGVEAARAAGAAWAVVSTINNQVEVIGTENDLGRAMAYLRNDCLKQAGVTICFEGKGLVYVVRGSDGGLF